MTNIAQSRILLYVATNTSQLVIDRRIYNMVYNIQQAFDVLRGVQVEVDPTTPNPFNEMKALADELQALLPSGLKVHVKSGPSYLGDPDRYGITLERNWSVSLPTWKELAFDMIYKPTWWAYVNRSTGKLNPEDMDHVRTRFMDTRKEIHKSMMAEWRNRNGSVASQKPSLKGKPRREVKKRSFEEYYQTMLDGPAYVTTPVIEDMPAPQHGKDASLTWGIEIEVAGARGVTTPYGWDGTSDGSLRSAYDDCGECNCECEDCTDSEDSYADHCDDVSGGCTYNHDEDEDTKEFVSPIIHEMIAPGVEQICSDVRFEPQNDTAGVHVHVGAEHLTPLQVGGLLYAYGLLENILESSYHREDREYCHGLEAHNVSEVMRQTRRATLATDLDASNRYLTVNVQALQKHGTIEFRAMGPIYDAGYLHKWALFCREMVNVAAANVPQKRWNAVRNFDDVLAIFREYGKEVKQLESVLVAA